MTDSSMTEEQPIDIHQYARAIRHALPKIFVLALFAAVTAAVQTFFLPAEAYKASTTILARDTLASNQFADATTVTRRLATVNLLTRTTDVLSLAASKLPGTTVDDLRSAVHSSASPEANVITINATADTAEAAAARANQVALALIATERRIEQQSNGALRAALAQIGELRSAGATEARSRPQRAGWPRSPPMLSARQVASRLFSRRSHPGDHLRRQCGSVGSWCFSPWLSSECSSCLRASRSPPVSTPRKISTRCSRCLS